MKSILQHNQDVENVQKALKTARSLGKKIVIKRSPQKQNITRDPRQYKADCFHLDISPFDRFIEYQLNEGEGVVVMEPLVTMVELTDFCLRLGCIPQVLPEFKGITVGGAINGGALESGSFKGGQFNDICESFDLILGNGDLVTCSRNQNEDLFYGISGAYGSLGILVKVVLRVVKATPFVKLNYTVFTNWEEAKSKLEKELANKKNVDYIDLLSFKRDLFVMVKGVRTSNIENKKVFSANRYWDHLYYKHVEEIANRNQKDFEEIMELREYLFRYDKGAFWMISHGLDSSFLTRFLFGWLLPAKLLYGILHLFETQTEWTFLVQDIYVPLKNVNQFIDYCYQNMDIRPLWMCPVVIPKDDKQLMSPHLLEGEHCVNIGIYGIPFEAKNRILPHHALRKLEQYLPSIGARKMLYANSYYPKDEFWNIYSADKYVSLRKKYFADGVFPDVMAKTTKTVPNWRFLAPNFKVLTFILYSLLIVVVLLVLRFYQ